MTDKVQKIKEEIERRVESMNSCLFKTAELGSEKFNDGELYAYKQILQFIDSLPEETKSEDLEEEIKNYIQKEYPDGIGFPNVPKIARHFAEWQEQKDKQLVGATQKISHQHGYDEGRLDMREEMMKDAISCNVDWYDGFILNYTQEQQDDILLKLKAKVGDKVKIIIVKED